MAPEPRVLAAIASGVVLAALGLGVALQRGRRSSAGLFAAFAVTWGAQVVAANLARVTDDEWWFWLTLSFLPAIGVFLVGFAAAYPVPWTGVGARAVVATFGALAVFAVVALVVAPRAVFAGFGPSAAGAPVRFGLLAPLLFVAPFYGAFAVAALRFFTVWRRGGPGTSQARWLLAGLVLFVSYANVWNLRLFASFPAYRDGLPTAALASLLVTYGAGVAVTVAIAVGVLRGGRDGTDWTLAACAVVPALVALAEWGIFALGAEPPESIGFWRLATAALVAYGIVRYQLFDIDLRIKWTLSRGAVAACIGGAFFAGAEYLEEIVPVNDTLLGVAAAGAIALVMRPLHGLAVRVVDRLLPGVHSSHAYLQRRKLEVYQLALARALSAGAAADDPFLAELARDLGLTENLRRAARAALARGHRSPARRPSAARVAD